MCSGGFFSFLCAVIPPAYAFDKLCNRRNCKKNKEETENMAKTLIIGGVAGGATAATRLRRLDEQMEIVLLERGDYISYANCGLPYYIGNVIKDRENLLLQTPENLKAKFNIDVRIRSEVTSINRDGK